MKSWIYERWLEVHKAKRLKRYKERNQGLDTRDSWYELGFFDGWCAGLNEKARKKK